MPQDAYTLRYIAKELNTILLGGKVNKIIQPSRDEINLIIYAGGKTHKLLMNTNASFARVGISSASRTAPTVAPNFCMLLRKHLSGATLIKVEQIEFERIIAFTFDCVGEFSRSERVLYAEIMGKYSNLILCENGIISGALKISSLQESFKRTLFPGAKYLFPQPQDKVLISDENALISLLNGFLGGDIAKFLFERVSGISYATARLICQNYRLTDNVTPFTKENAKLFAKFIQEFIFSNQTRSAILSSGSEYLDFYAVYDGGIPFNSVLSAQDAFYTQKETAREFGDKKRKLDSLLQSRRKKEEKKLALILERERECNNIEINKIYGELITANIYALKKGMEFCQLLNYYDENCPTVKITLDKTLTPAQNAQRYFKKYNKQKRTLLALAPQKAEAESELQYINSMISSIFRAENLLDLIEIEEELKDYGLIKVENTKKKIVKTSPFRTFVYQSFTIYAGRNNIQNDRLLKNSSPDDLWLHTQKYHSSHVIIKTDKKSVPDEVKLFAAELCAYFSDGKDGDKIPVDICERKFVKKPSKAKAGFVIYTDYTTLLVTPKRHAQFELENS